MSRVEEGVNEKAPGAYSVKGPSSGSDSMDEDTREFLQELDKQLDKVASFYNEKEREFLDDVGMLNTEFLTFHIPLPNSTNLDHSPNDLEKLDSVLAGTQPLQKRPTQDSYTTFASSIPETDDEEIVDPPTHSNGYSTTDTGDDTLYNRKPNEKRDSVSEKAVSSKVTRRNTVGASNFRSRRGSAIERSLSHVASMSGIEMAPGRQDVSSPSHFLQSAGLRRRRRGSTFTVADPENIEEYNKYYNFRVRCAATYISLSELKSYITTNKTAFDKILKKWDKVTGGNLRQAYFEKIVSSVEPFHPQRIVQLDASTDYVLGMYAAVFTSNNKHNAELELKMHMRDHIQFERTTVWKDMVGKERQTMDAHADVPKKGFMVPYINIFVSHKTLISLAGFLVSIILYIILMCIDTMGQYEASKCLALLVFAAVMWASEVIFTNLFEEEKKN
jgi:phosphate transporter